MVEGVIFLVGVVALAVAAFICLDDDEFGRAFVIGVGIILVCIGFDLYDERGMAKEKISSGEYSVVSTTKIQRGDHPYLNMLLKKDGEIRYYVFPEDMIVREKAGTPSSVEVIEKGDLKKIILR